MKNVIVTKRRGRYRQSCTPFLQKSFWRLLLCFQIYFWISKLRFCIFQVTKEPYKKGLQVPYENKLSCLQCKCYQVKRKVQTKLLDLFKFDHFVFLEPSLPTIFYFSSFELKYLLIPSFSKLWTRRKTLFSSDAPF